jgi:hypothetical protein
MNAPFEPGYHRQYGPNVSVAQAVSTGLCTAVLPTGILPVFEFFVTSRL